MTVREWTGTVVDGKYVIPDTPVDLPEGTRVRFFPFSASQEDNDLPEPIIRESGNHSPQQATGTET